MKTPPGFRDSPNCWNCANSIIKIENGKHLTLCRLYQSEASLFMYCDDYKGKRQPDSGIAQ